MRYLFAVVSVVLLAVVLAAFPRSVRSADEGAAKPVTVSLAVVEGGALNTTVATSVLHVIIQNTSDVPQKHFDEWNSWGYANLTIEWTDAQGHSGTVSKIPHDFGRNAATATVLQPGEALVRDISFDPKVWQGWPEATGRATLTLKVTYSPKDEPKTNGGAWTGTAVSKEQKVIISHS